MALPPIPPMNLSAPSSATASLNASGSMFQASGNGDWNVNMGGAQWAGMSPLLIVAALGLAWMLLKR